MAKTMRGAEDPTPAEEQAENMAADEAAVDADEAAVPELAEEPEPKEPEYVVVEYVGEPPYGREFHTSHTIEKSSGVLGHKTERKSFAGKGIEVPQDLVWHKDTGWIVKIDPSLTDLIEALRTQPFLKVHD
jgi:uncharacterized NAD-dependent epimerase/dehydratase family protein